MKYVVTVELETYEEIEHPEEHVVEAVRQYFATNVERDPLFANKLMCVSTKKTATKKKATKKKATKKGTKK